MARDSAALRVAPSVRVVAFYLPQFYPIPENDAWWGRGFTEWTNVTRARPLFRDHYQPHLPTELGFYDLRLRETRHAQILLAREHGIDAFCYHYYWFSGKRVLERPLDDMLADPASDIPFCLCWANENWTRRWDGAEDEVLLKQEDRPGDDLAFIRSVERFLVDPRYLRIEGAPILIVYHPQQLKDARQSLVVWREYWRGRGHGALHLCAALTHGNNDYARFGFDSGVQFPPNNLTSGIVNEWIRFHEAFKGVVRQMADVAAEYLVRRYTPDNVFRCVFPCWDNTARMRERAMIILNGTPDNYEFWLGESIRRTRAEYPGRERLVFINAWNEWAEGCHLEPDGRFGRGFLEATRRAARGESTLQDFTDLGLPRPGDFERRFGRDVREVLDYHFWLTFHALRRWVHRHPRLRKLLRAILPSRFRSASGT